MSDPGPTPRSAGPHFKAAEHHWHHSHMEQGFWNVKATSLLTANGSFHGGGLKQNQKVTKEGASCRWEQVVYSLMLKIHWVNWKVLKSKWTCHKFFACCYTSKRFPKISKVDFLNNSYSFSPPRNYYSCSSYKETLCWNPRNYFLKLIIVGLIVYKLLNC